jgi:hypothetical protein
MQDVQAKTVHDDQHNQSGLTLDPSMEKYIKQQLRIYLLQWGICVLETKKDVTFYIETSCPKDLPEVKALICAVKSDYVSLLCDLIDVKATDRLLLTLIQSLHTESSVEFPLARWAILTWFEVIVESISVFHEGYETITVEELTILAEQGNPAAQLFLGLEREDRSELSEAEYWYKKAADQNYPLAFLHLGNMCDITTEDGRAEAWDWYHKAVEAGCDQAYDQIRLVIRANLAQELNK